MSKIDNSFYFIILPVVDDAFNVNLCVHININVVVVVCLLTVISQLQNHTFNYVKNSI